MKTPRPIEKLINHFERLPGIGPKTAQRLVFHLLHFPQEEIEKFSESLIKFKTDIQICNVCKNVGESNPCEICQDLNRSDSLVAVVSTPLDVFALERAGFKGKYHVLHGVIDPLNNVGPDELFISHLVIRIKEYIDNPMTSFNTLELILATNTSMEGESTAMYLTKLIREQGFPTEQVKITRIARGLPVGGDIEYADDFTLLKALEGRSVC